MKKKNKEINIFSMSALDLFASAMGAFLLISVMALPYYLKVDKDLIKQVGKLEDDLKKKQSALDDAKKKLEKEKASLSKCKKKNIALGDQLDQCKDENIALGDQLGKCKDENIALGDQLGKCKDSVEDCRRGASDCAKELKKIFLLAVMTWNTKDDIDLHVIDPNGREYYYKKKTHSGSSYELSVDTTKGPGVEIWEGPNAQPGKYKIYYKYFNKKDNSKPRVKGRIYYRNKVVTFNTKTLSHQDQKILVAVITISDDGEVTIDEQ